MFCATRTAEMVSDIALPPAAALSATTALPAVFVESEVIAAVLACSSGDTAVGKRWTQNGRETTIATRDSYRCDSGCGGAGRRGYYRSGGQIGGTGDCANLRRCTRAANARRLARHMCAIRVDIARNRDELLAVVLRRKRHIAYDAVRCGCGQGCHVVRQGAMRQSKT